MPQGDADSGYDGGGGPPASVDGGGHDAGSGGASPGAAADSGDATDGSPDAPTIVTPDIKVVMYLPNWSGSFANWANTIDFNKMTHLNLAFGTTDSSNGWSLGAADSDVQTLAAAAHAHNVKILVSIGGASDDIGIINQYQNASNIGPLVANLDAFVSRLGLDGVDVDLERGGQMTSSSNYPKFINQLFSTFRPEGKLVTSALAQYIMQDAGDDSTIQSLAQSFDFINDMIYVTDINTYTNEATWWTTTQGLPNTKLVWGILFDNNLSVATASQIAMDSKAYGGTMVWEYSQPTEAQLWPAIQSVF